MKKLLGTIAIGLSAFTLLSGTSCHIDKKIASAEISKGYTRSIAEKGTISDDFKTKMTNFSFSFFQNTITKDEKNDLVSPLSAALCLGLINNGARGNTRAQIETMFDMTTEELNASLYAYTSNLYSSDDCKVSLANSVWFRENALTVHPDFLQANADWYEAQAYASPFDASTVKDINNWCYNHTTGKIKKIINEIPPLAMMYLINALDFDAKWQTKYENSDVKNGVFHNYNTSEKDVKMLYSNEYTYLLDDNAVGFSKAYKGGKYSFVALLPDEGVDIYDYANSLTGEEWTRLWSEQKERNTKGERRDVYVRMPEFTYDMEISLNETLQAMGVTDMFSPDVADFSGIDETTPLYCDIVKQKTMIQHDRNGTKAAAITLGGMKCMSAAPAEPLYIVLDRPFLYAIMDEATKLPLFLGVVTNL